MCQEGKIRDTFLNIVVPEYANFCTLFYHCGAELKSFALGLLLCSIAVSRHCSLADEAAEWMRVFR